MYNSINRLYDIIYCSVLGKFHSLVWIVTLLFGSDNGAVRSLPKYLLHSIIIIVNSKNGNSEHGGEFPWTSPAEKVKRWLLPSNFFDFGGFLDLLCFFLRCGWDWSGRASVFGAACLALDCLEEAWPGLPQSRRSYEGEKCMGNLQ